MNVTQSLVVGIVVTVVGGLLLAYVQREDSPPDQRPPKQPPGQPRVEVVSLEVDGRIRQEKTTFIAVVANQGSAPTPDYAVGFSMNRTRSNGSVQYYTPSVIDLNSVAGGGGLARLPPIQPGSRREVRAKVHHPDSGSYALEFYVMHPVSAQGSVLKRKSAGVVIPNR